MFKAGLAGVADEVERVHESHKSNFASPSLAIDQNIPGVNITANVRHSLTCNAS
jgi:hypothetical protein